MFEIKEAVQPKKEIRDKKSLSAETGSLIYIYRETLLELQDISVLFNHR